MISYIIAGSSDNPDLAEVSHYINVMLSNYNI